MQMVLLREGGTTRCATFGLLYFLMRPCATRCAIVPPDDSHNCACALVEPTPVEAGIETLPRPAVRPAFLSAATELQLQFLLFKLRALLAVAPAQGQPRPALAIPGGDPLSAILPRVRPADPLNRRLSPLARRKEWLTPHSVKTIGVLWTIPPRVLPQPAVSIGVKVESAH